MQEENKILVEKQGAVTMLHIQGDVTAFSEPFLTKAYGDVNEQGASKIVLKFDENAYINSGGIAVLIQLLAQSKRNNQKIGITGLSDHFIKIFHMVGITKFTNIYASVEQAMADLSGS
jgi:anti-anti-sigma factor